MIYVLRNDRLVSRAVARAYRKSPQFNEMHYRIIVGCFMFLACGMFGAVAGVLLK